MHQGTRNAALARRRRHAERQHLGAGVVRTAENEAQRLVLAAPEQAEATRSLCDAADQLGPPRFVETAGVERRDGGEVAPADLRDRRCRDRRRITHEGHFLRWAGPWAAPRPRAGKEVARAPQRPPRPRPPPRHGRRRSGRARAHRALGSRLPGVPRSQVLTPQARPLARFPPRQVDCRSPPPRTQATPRPPAPAAGRARAANGRRAGHRGVPPAESGIESGENRPVALTGRNACSENLERGKPDQRPLQSEGETARRRQANPNPGEGAGADRDREPVDRSERRAPLGRDFAQHGHERLRMPAAGLDAPVGGHLALGPERGRAGRRCRVEPE